MRLTIATASCTVPEWPHPDFECPSEPISPRKPLIAEGDMFSLRTGHLGDTEAKKNDVLLKKMRLSAEETADCSLMSLHTRQIKIGVRDARHARVITFQLADVAVSGNMLHCISTAMHRPLAFRS